MNSFGYEAVPRVRWQVINTTPGFDWPPVPPDGWPVPRAGDMIPCNVGQDGWYEVKQTEWDYWTYLVTVFLELHIT